MVPIGEPTMKWTRSRSEKTGTGAAPDLRWAVAFLVIAVVYGALHHNYFEGPWILLWLAAIAAGGWEVFRALRARRRANRHDQ